MSRPLVRRTLAAVSASAVALGIAAAAPMTADAATTFQAFGGNAYGTYARFGSVANSGKSAYLTLCNSTPGITRNSSSTAVTVPGKIGYLGATVTQVSSRDTGTTASSVSTTKSAAVDLLRAVPGLKGMVTADSITAKATSTKTGSTYKTVASSQFVNLRIAGVLQADQSPAPNTKVTIPGVADIFLNQQAVTSVDHQITVNALRVNVLPNAAGYARGVVVVASAQSSIKTVTSMAYGNAYGTQVDVGGVVKSGATASVTLPCGGSGGTVRTSNVAGLLLPPVLTTGVAKTSAASFPTATNNKAVTLVTVSGVKVLNDVLTVDAVTSKASADRRSSGLTTSTMGSSIAGLKINGRTYTGSFRENTKVSIAGVGTLTVNQVIRTSSGIEVRGLSLTLTQNVGTTLKGTTVNVAVAKAGVYPR